MMSYIENHFTFSSLAGAFCAAGCTIDAGRVKVAPRKDHLLYREQISGLKVIPEHSKILDDRNHSAVVNGTLDMVLLPICLVGSVSINT